MTKYIRLDIAGENKLFEQFSKSSDWKFNWQFEYMPRDTPQHNHMAKLGFAVIINKGRALGRSTDIICTGKHSRQQLI